MSFKQNTCSKLFLAATWQLTHNPRLGCEAYGGTRTVFTSGHDEAHVLPRKPVVFRFFLAEVPGTSATLDHLFQVGHVQSMSPDLPKNLPKNLLRDSVLSLQIIKPLKTANKIHNISDISKLQIYII